MSALDVQMADEALSGYEGSAQSDDDDSQPITGKQQKVECNDFDVGYHASSETEHTRDAESSALEGGDNESDKGDSSNSSSNRPNHKKRPPRLNANHDTMLKKTMAIYNKDRQRRISSRSIASSSQDSNAVEALQQTFGRKQPAADTSDKVDQLGGMFYGRRQSHADDVSAHNSIQLEHGKKRRSQDREHESSLDSSVYSDDRRLLA